MPKEPHKKNIASSPALKQRNAGINKEQKTGISSKKRLCLLLAAIVFLIYANTLRNGYAMDDATVIRDNTIVKKGIQAIPQLLATPRMEGYIIMPNDTYRPLSLVMFAIEYQLFGENPAIGHFFNILVYIGCVILLFLFLDKLFDGQKTIVAFLAAFLFALHPIHTEVVANIKSRDEELCYFFGLLSLYIFMMYAKTGKVKQLIAGATCLFLAFLSKETVISFIAIVPLVFFFYKNEDKKRSAIITVITFGVAVLFIGIRAIILNAYHTNAPEAIDFTANALINSPSFASRIATEFFVIGKYLKLLLLPYPLLCNYSPNSLPFVDFDNVWVWVSITIYGSIVGISLTRLIKRRKDPWAFGMLFFLGTLLLFTNFFFLIGSEMTERFLFFPSTGFCIVVALALEQWIVRTGIEDITSLKSAKGIIILVVFSGIWGGMTIARNNDWKNNYTLFKADVKKSPEDSRLNYYMGLALMHNNNEESPENVTANVPEGISYLYKALAIYPDFSEADAELASIYDANHYYDSAIKYNLAALTVHPDNSIANYNLGREYYILKRYSSAIPLFIKTIAISPDFEFAYLNLARCYFYRGQYDSAIVYYNKTLDINKNQTVAIREMAAAYQKMKEAKNDQIVQ